MLTYVIAVSSIIYIELFKYRRKGLNISAFWLPEVHAGIILISARFE
jgi:hypothetical protein